MNQAYKTLEADYKKIKGEHDARSLAAHNKAITDFKKQLTPLRAAFQTADKNKKAYDTKETELKATKATVDGNGSSTTAQKNAAAKALSDHQATKTAITKAFTDTKKAMTDKEGEIATKEKQKKDAEATAAKADGDAREAELKTLKQTEQTQYNNLKAQLTEIRKQAAANVFDDAKFAEGYKKYKETEGKLNAVKARLDKYTTEYTGVKAAKDTRDAAKTKGDAVTNFNAKA